ncbi:hypothetical protein CW731_10720 [Polaribacter sp. ALD11]|nr:hypothetical protein CW731_10720 [Polaribacter sp. ALD11]
MTNEIRKQSQDCNRLIGSNVIEKPLGEKLDNFLMSEAFELMSKIKIKSKNDIIDFTQFFTKEDFDYMKCQLSNNKVKNWKQILNKEDFFIKSDSISNTLKKYKNFGDILANKNYQNILETRGRYLYYSIPLFSKNKKYALLYRETISSGSLFILKNLNNEWTYYAKGTVWIE